VSGVAKEAHRRLAQHKAKIDDFLACKMETITLNVSEDRASK